MKKIFIIAAVLAIGACAKQIDSCDLQKSGTDITGTVQEFKMDESLTRTNLEYSSKGIAFYWAATDEVGIFGPTGKRQIALGVEVPAGEKIKKADFTITQDFVLKSGSKYTAYFPMAYDLDATLEAVPFEFPAEQTQSGNTVESTAHLGAYDFIASGATAKGDNSATFSFSHKCTPVNLYVTVPAGTYKSVALRSAEEDFIVKGTFNLTGATAAPTAITTSNEMKVMYSTAVTTSGTEKLSAWFMTHPADLSSKNLEIVVTTADDKELVSDPVSGRNMVAGTAYRYKGEVKADIGELPGEFSVSATQKVKFSKGNLWCDHPDSNTYKWYFEENQYDYRTYGTTNPAVINGESTTTPSNHWGLIGWSGASGTSKWGINTSTGSTYGGNFVDWGTNPIINGGNDASLNWKTMSKDDWDYLFNKRSNASSKAKKSKVNNVDGLILLPDEFTYPSGLGTNIAASYTKDDWDKMEKAGAVFLPEAGIRYSNDVRDSDYTSNGKEGSYWTSTKDGTTTAYRYYFAANVSNLYNSGSPNRRYGYCVRLVRNVTN